MNHFLAKLAKEAVESYVSEKKVIDPPQDTPKNYSQRRAGIFVTINKNKELRGCIGTYGPTKNSIAEEVIANAIAAASEDTRFDAVGKSDLPSLSYIVYILQKPEPVKLLGELDPKKFGIIVFGTTSQRSSLLLPDLDGINTADEQLACVCRKAGIDAGKEKLIIQKFRADKFV